MPTLGNHGRASPLKFVVEARCNGKRLRALVDTGASVSFIAERFVATHKLKSKPAEDNGFPVRLGNGDTHDVSKRIKNAKVTVNSVSGVLDVFPFPLPKGIDFVVGMDFMDITDVLLHPRTKRLVAYKDDKEVTVANLNSLTYCLAMDRIQRFEEETSQAVRDHDHDGDMAREGIFTLEKKAEDGGELSIEVVGDDLYNRLLRKVRTNSLDWEAYTNPVTRKNIKQSPETVKRIEET